MLNDMLTARLAEGKKKTACIAACVPSRARRTRPLSLKAGRCCCFLPIIIWAWPIIRPSSRRPKRRLKSTAVAVALRALISGSMAVHHELEQRLATLKKTEAALVFPTGYHANIGVLSALMGTGAIRS